MSHAVTFPVSGAGREELRLVYAAFFRVTSTPSQPKPRGDIAHRFMVSSVHGRDSTSTWTGDWSTVVYAHIHLTRMHTPSSTQDAVYSEYCGMLLCSMHSEKHDCFDSLVC